jgi:hypothetical protein
MTKKKEQRMSKDLKTRMSPSNDDPHGFGLMVPEETINTPTLHSNNGGLYMDDAVLREELLKHLDQLPPELRRLVLEYSRKLARSAARGTSGKELLRFFGTLAPDDAATMAREIDSACEQVNVA